LAQNECASDISRHNLHEQYTHLLVRYYDKMFAYNIIYKLELYSAIGQLD